MHGVKVCPVCGARAFADARRCYGCLYTFGEKEDTAEIGGDDAAGTPSLLCAGEHAARAVPVDQPDVLAAPTFLVSVRAVRGAGGRLEWRCDVGCQEQGSGPLRAAAHAAPRGLATA